MTRKLTTALTMTGVLALCALPAGAAEPTTQPSVPDSVIKQIGQKLERPKPNEGESRADYARRVFAGLDEVLKLGTQAESSYPDAPNLHKVQGPMFEAAAQLARFRRDAASDKLLSEIAARVVSSKASAELRAHADAHVTLRQFLAHGESVPEAGKDVEKLVRDFVARYAKTDAAGLATMHAVILSLRGKRTALVGEFLDALESKYLDTPGARGLLRDFGRHPDIGKPFQATLPRLDGTQVALPDDLKGKVVVIDFWATWCVPCTQSMPHMKQVYEKYKDRGVEIVGISLDSNRGELEKYVTDEKIGWVITYTGKGWDDPTVEKYGIDGIPSMWVVGKDGNVVSDSARARLEATIEKALK